MKPLVTNKHPRLNRITLLDLIRASTWDFWFFMVAIVIGTPMIVFGQANHRLNVVGILGVVLVIATCFCSFVGWVTEEPCFMRRLHGAREDKTVRRDRIVIEPTGENVKLTHYRSDNKYPDVIICHAESEAERAHEIVAQWSEEKSTVERATPEARALANVLKK